MRFHYFHICGEDIKLKVKSPGLPEANGMQITIYDNVSHVTVFIHTFFQKMNCDSFTER